MKHFGGMYLEEVSSYTPKLQYNKRKNKIPISVWLHYKNIKQIMPKNKLFSILKKIKQKKCTKRKYPKGAFFGLFNCVFSLLRITVVIICDIRVLIILCIVTILSTCVDMILSFLSLFF